jgi:acyl-CoA synthetase (AMP-forming)/AMP-acid ligase II
VSVTTTTPRPEPFAGAGARGGSRVNIADRLAEAAQRWPDKPAVVWPMGSDAFCSITFAELDGLADRVAGGLKRAGMGCGMRTVLLVPPGREFFALVFALFRIGAPPVMIDPGMGARRMAACLARVAPTAFIGVSKAHWLRVLWPGAFRSVRVAVTLGRRLLWGGLTSRGIGLSAECPRRVSSSSRVRAPASYDVTDAADVAADAAEPFAAILFTSGSTGPAKAVAYSHAMFDAQVELLRSHFGYQADEVDLATFPLFALFDVALGMTAVIPAMDASRPGRADPSQLLHAIAANRCTQMFASPALLRRIVDHGPAGREALGTLRRIVTAGAPVSPRLLDALHELLPPACDVHTPYGATEALPICDIESREILGETRRQTAAGAGTCVGRPLDGVEVRVIEIDDRPIGDWREARELPPGQIGEIVVRGAAVTRKYVADPQTTAAAKLNDDRGDVWHRMGDVGWMDDRGRLWYCGRKSQRVTTASGALFTECVEGVFNAHPAGLRTALVGVGRPANATPVLCVELRRGCGRQDRDRVHRELLEIGGKCAITRGIRTILFHSAFPVDPRHNAKIVRERLARWAAGRVR